MRFKRTLLNIGALAIALSAASQAMAATHSTAAQWTSITPTAGPISIDGSTVFYSPAPAAGIWSYNGNITGQNTDNIQAVTETQFGLGANTLSAVAGCDNATSGCTANAMGGLVTGTPYTNAFQTLNGASFDYLAVHFGKGELLFHWNAPVTSFEIGGLPTGLSNYRAYSEIAAIPEPETYAMLIAGLGMMGAWVRRRNPA